MTHKSHPFLILLAVITFSAHILNARGEAPLIKKDALPTVLAHVSGDLWVNTRLSDAPDVRIEIPSAVIVPIDATVAIKAKEGSTDVYSVSGMTRIMLERESGKTVGQFLLPQGFRATIFPEKVNGKLSKLLLAKLLKEFQVSPIAKTFYEDAWTRDHLREDEQALDAQVKAYHARVQERGTVFGSLEGFSASMKSLLQEIGGDLTFDSKRREKRLFQSAVALVNDAEYFLLIGNATEADKRLERFRAEVSEIPHSNQMINRLLKERRTIIAKDPLHPATQSLRTIYPTFVSARAMIRDLYDGNGKLFSEYRTLWKAATTASSFSSEERKPLLQEEHFLLASLIQSRPMFFEDSYFAHLKELEQELLNTFSEGVEKDEQRQSLIADKMRFLAQLQRYFFDDAVAMMSARSVAFRLINEIHDLLPVHGGHTAVIKRFERDLLAFADFWGYLNSSQFSQSLAYGSTHKERFAAYMKETKERLTIQALTKQILSGIEIKSSIRAREDILAQITSDFQAIGAKNLVIGSFTNPLEKFVPIESVTVGNVKLSGQYDYEQRLFSEITANGKKIFQGAVQIEKLEPLLRVTFSAPKSGQSGASAPEKVTLAETKAEKLARIAVMQKLTDKGMEVELEQITLLGGAEKGESGPIRFHLADMKLLPRPEVVFSFDYELGKDVISNVMVMTPLNDREVDATDLTLDEILQAVELAYDEAMIEKLEKEVGE